MAVIVLSLLVGFQFALIVGCVARLREQQELITTWKTTAYSWKGAAYGWKDVYTAARVTDTIGSFTALAEQELRH